VEDITELEDELTKLLEADNRYVLTTINDFPRLRDFINGHGRRCRKRRTWSKN
jgi:hypothetical protein